MEEGREGPVRLGLGTGVRRDDLRPDRRPPTGGDRHAARPHASHLKPQDRRRIRRQATAIALATAPFGVAFGVAARDAGLSLLDTIGFSVFVFTGSAQFAAVSVIGDGGTAAAAISAGLLLNLRSLAFGVAMAPALGGPRWWRAAASQLMIDESTAVASAQPTRELRRYGYLVGGLTVFATWNLATLLGASVLSSSETLITDLGFDATIPATFLALLWARLADRRQLAIAVVGAALAFAFVPITPAGIPILIAGVAVVLTRPWRPAGVRR